MKKVLAVVTASFMIAGFTANTAFAKHHRTHHKMHNVTSGASMPAGGMARGNNAELKGNTATSAGGSNSLANTNNPGGMGNNAGPPMK